MGLLFSRFYDKPSTRDTLERIESELQNIEERRWSKIKQEQFVVQILSFIPITIVIGTLCILIYPSDSSWRDKLILCVPSIIVTLALVLCRKTVQWYSRWSLDNEENRLRKLQKEKKKILEMVCETESYKVAAELLEKYDPKRLRRRENVPERPSTPLNTTLTKISASPNRQAAQAANQSISFMNQSMSFPVNTTQIPLVSPAAPPPTPAPKQLVKGQPAITSLADTTLSSSIKGPAASTVLASSVQGCPVRPILSKDRSMFDRFVDWVVGDGPENRFALICRYCYYHNGMSLAEEFETINFRCCYCFNLNTPVNRRHQIHDQLQSSNREKSDNATSERVVDDVEKKGTDNVPVDYDEKVTQREDSDEISDSKSKPSGKEEKKKV